MSAERFSGVRLETVRVSWVNSCMSEPSVSSLGIYQLRVVLDGVSRLGLPRAIEKPAGLNHSVGGK
jgi:hypothetical protein